LTLKLKFGHKWVNLINFNFSTPKRRHNTGRPSISKNVGACPQSTMDMDLRPWK